MTPLEQVASKLYVAWYPHALRFWCELADDRPDKKSCRIMAKAAITALIDYLKKEGAELEGDVIEFHTCSETVAAMLQELLQEESTND